MHVHAIGGSACCFPTKRSCGMRRERKQNGVHVKKSRCALNYSQSRSFIKSAHKINSTVADRRPIANQPLSRNLRDNRKLFHKRVFCSINAFFVQYTRQFSKNRYISIYKRVLSVILEMHGENSTNIDQQKKHMFGDPDDI